MRDLPLRDARPTERLNEINFALSREREPDFVKAFVNLTAKLFEVDNLFLGRIDVRHKHIATIASSNRGLATDCFSYAIEGTPCEAVMSSGALIFEDNLAAAYPDSYEIQQMGWRGYIGIPLYNGPQSVGILVATFKQRITDADEILAVFNHYRRRLTHAVLSEESANRAALAIKGTSDGIIDWCVHSDEVYLSARARELLGYQSRDFRAGAEAFRALLHQDDRGRFRSAWRAHTDSGRPFDLSVRIKTVGGAYRWFRVRCEAVRTAEGDPVRLVGAMTDIHDLVEARQQATEASRAKSQFLATMSHEVRTPLNGILGMSAIMATTELDESQKEMVELIHQSGESLLDILNDVLDIARLESGRFEIEPSDYNPYELIQSVVSPYRMKAIEKGLNMHVTIDPCADRQAEGDPGRIRQILSNILSNALKFTDRGEVRVRCTTIQLDDGGQDVFFEVADTGMGMDETLVSKIFNPFSQGESEMCRRHGGTGLGLPISRKLAELMGGDITVESAPGAGSVFRVRLPATRIEPATLSEVASA